MSFSFQINISVKISAGLLQNLRGNLDEKSIERFDRDVPGMYMDEVEFKQIARSLVQRVIFPPKRASLGREGLRYNLTEQAQQLFTASARRAQHLSALILYEHFRV